MRKKDLTTSTDPHKIIIATDGGAPNRAFLFVDGKSLVLDRDFGIEADFRVDDLQRVRVELLVDTIEVISLEEMEERLI